MNKINFKQTEIGEIPEDWDVKSVGDIIALEYGKALKAEVRKEGQIPVYGSNGIVGYHQSSLVPGPGILVGRKGSVGEVHYSEKEFWPIDTTYYVSFKENVNKRWLFYLLKSLRMEHLTDRGNVPGLNRNDAYEKRFACPKQESERGKIAAVLTTADSAIEKTDVMIEQSKQVKKGLMQDLLTRGIGHKKFKQTEIGEIPEEWEVTHLFNVSEFIRNGTTANQNGNGDANLKKVTRIETISDGIVDLSKTGKIKPFEGIDEFRIRRGDILFSHINSVKHIGKVALFNSDEEIYHGMNLFLIRPSNSIDSQFLFYTLSSYRAKKYYEARCKKAVNQASLNKGEVGSLALAKPPLPEQQKIAEILSAADAKIEAEVEKKKQLETLKKGLMQDLLTGHVRFPEFVKGVST